MSAALVPTVHWLDGRRAESMPLPDRGIEYGDGLFETLLYADGRVLYPERHLQRLKLGLSALGFPDCSQRAALELEQVCAELGPMEITCAAIRLTVTRGSGSRGYAPPDPCLPRILIGVTPLDTDWRAQPSPAHLGTATIRLATQSQLAGIKHLNRLEQVLAARERVAGGYDEMLMLDATDNVVSVISGNLFAVVRGRIVTPRLQSCGVRGTRRALLIDRWAAKIGMPVDQQAFGIDLLQRAEELFYCNALLGLRPIAAAAGCSWPEHPVCRVL